MPAFQNYSAYDERKQPVCESSLPFHGRLNHYAHGRLRAMFHVEMKDQQRRGVERLVDTERDFGFDAAAARPEKAKIVALGHLHPHPCSVRIGPRTFDQKRFAPVFGSDRDAFIELLDVYIEPDAFCLIYSTAQALPSEPPDHAPVHGEDMSGAAVPLAPDKYLAFAHEVAFEDFACRNR